MITNLTDLFTTWLSVCIPYTTKVTKKKKNKIKKASDCN